MATPRQYLSSPPRSNLLLVIVALWGAAAVALISLLGSGSAAGGNASKAYLLPWCVLTGIVIAAPSVYHFYHGTFNPFHPLIYPAWSYFFPGFVIGGLMLTFGLSQPYFLAYIQDETYNLPLTFIYIMIGYGAMTVGFSIKYAKLFGSRIGQKLPHWHLEANRTRFPGFVLLLLGLGTTIIAFIQGILGFQKVDTIGSFDGIIYLLSLFWLEATFLLWLCIFRRKKLTLADWAIIFILLLTSLTKSAFQGNRGSLLQIIVMIVFAFVSSGRRLVTRHYVVGSIFVLFALIGGMIYGTTFRSVKQSQEQTGIGEYATMVSDALSKLTEQDLGTTLVVGSGALAERLDNVSPLAVLVSNYEALAPYEELWGIANNIYVDTVTLLIPRFIWPNKPVTIDPSKYGDLYFNYGENSFTMTPMGDLLRNFGPLGVPIGMLALGFLLRVIYSALIEDRTFSIWRATLYFMLLTSISYEGVYGLILPNLLKIGITTLVGILIVVLIARASELSKSKPAAPR